MPPKILLTILGSAVVAIAIQIPFVIWLRQTLGPTLGLVLPLLLNLVAGLHRLMVAIRKPVISWLPPVDAPFFCYFFACFPFAFFLFLVHLLAALLRSTAPELADRLPDLLAMPLALGSLGLSTYTVLTRHLRVIVRPVRIAVRDLPAELEGYRIVHMSDLHIGPFMTPDRARAWVESANKLEGDLVALTGDYIVTGTEYHRDTAAALGGLRARDGVFASMGNHDYFGDGEALAWALRDAGLTLLRNEGRVVERGSARLYVAGADDTWTKKNDVAAALRARPAGSVALLLAHDPDLLPEAAQHGADVMLSGHTHGGQIAIPGLSKVLNYSLPITNRTAGIYRKGQTTLYVTRGLGVTFMPLRVGVPPELAVITLVCAR